MTSEIHASVSAALALAVDRATQAATPAKALTAAWGAMHHHPDLIRLGQSPDDPYPQAIGAAFRAWCTAEGFDAHPSGLGAVLRRRHSSVAAIVEGLERAVKLHAGEAAG